jgi:hypothetical protein
LVIGGTIFTHKTCHKATLVSPNQQTENEIDHLAISRNWQSSFIHLHSKRGADDGSDHHLVVAHFKIKILAKGKK